MSEPHLLPQHIQALRLLLQQASGYASFLQKVFSEKRSQLGSVIASARPYFAASLLEHSSAPLLWITANSQRAEQLYQDLQPLLGDDWQALIFPEIHDDNAENSAWRLQVLQTLNELKEEYAKDLNWANPSSRQFRQTAPAQLHHKLIIIAPIAALFKPTLNEERLQKGKMDIKVGDTIDMSTLVELLCSEGYERVPLVEKRGDIAVRGGILDIYPLTGQPVRLEFDDDQIDEMRHFDIDTQCTVSFTESATLMPATEYADTPGQQAYFTDILGRMFPETIVCLEDRDLVMQEAREYYEEWTAEKGSLGTEDEEGQAVVAHVRSLLEDFRQIDVGTWPSEENAGSAYDVPFSKLPIFERNIQDLLDILPQWQKENARTVIITRQAKRLQELLAENGILNVRCGNSADLLKNPLQFGQIWLLSGYQAEGWQLQLQDGQLRLLTDRELTGQRRLRYSVQQSNRRRHELHLDELSPGDYVVHINYGIGRYDGVFNEEVQGVCRDMLRVAFSDGSVSITVDSIDKLQKYHALKDVTPSLSRLQGKKWSQAKSKSLASAHEIAQELLKIAAMREKAGGFPYQMDSPWIRDFVQAFPYVETPDQHKAIEDVMNDLRRERPMDRLICGDVGFGKTEVALRAAFVVAIEGRQVAVLAPTTVLAQQHYQTFKERMASFPVHLELLSRVKTAKEQKDILKRLEDGQIDIIIGTHRLLSKDVHFKNLGLIVVDEEHRFGVTHKERLKELRSNVDVLTMSATPIPRTLQMSLYGIRGLSLIETPPAERLPIKTFLKQRDNETIRVSILRELHREGQVFYLHNRIKDIDYEYTRLQKLVPQARIRVAHGQMNPKELEQIMLDFYDGQFDVLISTTIIENGLDIPNVNTIIIDNAHMFGLAQLYQLRGRVGRSTKQGYCYLLIPSISRINENAVTRLETLRDFTKLGDGYRIARRDMELRGAGDILGSRQSGHVAAVGFELYCQMLREALEEMSGKVPEASHRSSDSTRIDRIPVSTGIPDSYLDDAGQKVSFYKRIASASLEELQRIGAELTDRFGEMPETTSNLLSLVAIKRKGTDLLIMEIRIADGILYLHMPLASRQGIEQALSYTQRRRLNKIVPDWQPHWYDREKMLVFSGLYGIAAGHTEYPPSSVLLGNINAILDELAAW